MYHLRIRLSQQVVLGYKRIIVVGNRRCIKVNINININKNK